MFKCDCCNNELRLDGDSIELFHARARTYTAVILCNADKIELAKLLLNAAGVKFNLDSNFE